MCYDRVFSIVQEKYDEVMVLNHKIWQWHEVNEELARLYNSLWENVDNYACENLQGEELEYFYSTLD